MNCLYICLSTKYRPRTKDEIMHFVLIFLITCLISTSSLAASNISKNNDLCKNATHVSERKFNIPRNLLRAISLTESGRWVEQEKANIAWPWTVASGKAGEFFPNKYAAIQHVKKLQARGIKNIDVGCMQINLRYHPKAFNNLNEAFDPYQNANYAGNFLSRLFKETKSWSAASGRYHSSEPTKNMYYREKVMAYWNHANKEGQQGLSRKPKSYRVARIDNNRTRTLNNSFRDRLEQQRKAFSRAEQMNAQISKKRDSLRLFNYSTLNAKANRARKVQQRKKSLTLTSHDTRGLKPKDFSARRSAQLDKWRRTTAKPELFKKTQTTSPTTLLTQ